MKTEIKIFLCYARKDVEIIERFYKNLLDSEFIPWMDTKDILPGENWKFSIENAIRESEFFVACITSNSLNRRGFLQKEINQALRIWEEKLESDIYLIPVRFEDCKVPEILSRFQWVDLFGINGWDKLMSAFNAGLDRRHANKSYTIGLQSDLSQNKNSSQIGYLTNSKANLNLRVPLFDNYIFMEKCIPNIEKSLIKEFGWTQKKAHAAFFVIGELAANAFEHGCKGRGELEVSINIRIEPDGETFVVRIKSPGAGFKLVDILNKAKKLKNEAIRGRGLWFVNEISDKLVASSDGLIIQAIILKDSKLDEPKRVVFTSAETVVIGKKKLRIVPITANIDQDSAEELIEHVRDVLENEPEISGLIFDLDKVYSVDSSGIGFMISSCRECWKAKKFIGFANGSAGIVSLIELINLHKLLPFPLFETIDEAVLSFKMKIIGSDKSID